jgi:hypothetical protein
MLPDFIQARVALKKKQRVVLTNSIRQHLPPYLREAEFKVIYEGDRLSVESAEGPAIEKPIGSIHVESETQTITDLKANPNLLYPQLQQMGKEFAQKMTQQMVQTVIEVAERNGNMVRGATLDNESIFSVLEKYPLEFDDSGQPIFPPIQANPETCEKVVRILNDIETTPDLKARHDQIIEIKRKEWNDRQNSRKLD